MSIIGAQVDKKMNSPSSSNDDKLLKKEADGNSTKALKPSSKVFQLRKSILEDLYEKGQLPIYNFMVPIILGVTLILMLLYYIIHNEFARDFEFLKVHLYLDIQNFHIIFALCSGAGISCMITCFLGLSLWRYIRALTEYKRFVDNLALVLCAMFYFLYFALPLTFVTISDLSVIGRWAFSFTQMFYFMKLHSYIRESIPNVLSSSEIDKDHEKPKDLRTSFGRILYFIAAPTAIYRDSYPRVQYFDWRKCIQYLVGGVCVIVIPLVPMSFFLSALLRKCQNQLSTLEAAREIILLFTSAIILLFVIVQFGILHLYFNMQAEMTKFGDRIFYLDWWNITSRYDLSRKLSFPVQEWLHLYIYDDCCNVLQFKKQTAAILTFVFSAICHDYLFAAIFSYTLPTYSIMAIPTVIFLGMRVPSKGKPSKPKDKKKAILWIQILLILLAMIIMNFFVICDRMKCSKTHEASWISILYPRVSPC